MAQASSKHFRLLDLPAEMRVQIYEYAFGDDSPEEVDVFELASLLPQPALTAVSKLVRRECSSSFENAHERFWRNHILYPGRSDDDPPYLVSSSGERRLKLCARMSKLRPLKEGIAVRFRRKGLPYPWSDGFSVVVSLNGSGAAVVDIERLGMTLEALAQARGESIESVRRSIKYVVTRLGQKWASRYDKYVGGGSRSGLSLAGVLFTLV